jgi:transient receptor potential cation channel subfamily A protein 1
MDKSLVFCKNNVSDVLQAAESGNVEDFGRLYLAEPGRLGVRDSRGRAAAHQAAARNKLNILQFIAAHGGGMTITNRAACGCDQKLS